MPALFFPTRDTMRLVLASGLVPSALTQAPTRVEHHPAGGVWLEVAELPSREILASLARWGIIPALRPATTPSTIASWAEIVPLYPQKTESAPTILYELPQRQMTALLRWLCRGPRPLIGWQFLTQPYDGYAWVTVQPPPAPSVAFDHKFPEIRSYYEQLPGVWVARDWVHPLATQLVVPTGTILLCHPVEGVVHRPGPVPQPVHYELTLRPQPTIPTRHDPLPPITIHPRLLSCATTPPPTLWVFPPEQRSAFDQFCSDANEHLLRKLSCARIENGDEQRILIRLTNAADNTAALPPAAMGFFSDPRLPALHVPSGFQLRPHLRAEQLARAVSYSPGYILWLERTDAGFTLHRVPVAAFQPLDQQLEHSIPPLVSWIPHHGRSGALDFERFTLQTETTIDLLPPTPTISPPTIGTTTKARAHGWFAQSCARILSWMRRKRASSLPPTSARPSGHPTSQASAQPAPAEETPSDTEAAPTGRPLATTEALRLGHDWVLRRQALEGRILEDFSQLPAQQRARRWAELATLYTTTGQALDAALCWMNAIWDCSPPPQEWLQQWAAAECRAAGVDHSDSWDRWLSSPSRPGIGRVVAAIASGMGQQAVPSEWVRLLPRIVGMLEQKLDDIPVRAAWLARWAITRGGNGDTLGLARWYDRLLRRLQDRGPALDLDAPSFLRFHGRASPERFKQACDRLKHLRKPIREWVERPRGLGGLQAVGLAAETKATVEYAQLMLAWGLAVLGERTLARDWAAWARKALSLVVAPRVDPAAHAFLADLFLWRIQEANEGTLPKPGWPPPFQQRWDNLPEFARYAIDRLRQHSRILQPLGVVRPYGGRDLREFFGSDRLGDRLHLFAAQTDPAIIVEEGRALLALATREPTTATVPRVVYSLLQSAAYFDCRMTEELLALVPVALEWVETWLQAGRWTETERLSQAVMIRSSLLAMASDVATPRSIESLFKYLIRACSISGIPPAIEAAALRLFRAARRGACTPLVASLMESLDPQRGHWNNDATHSSLRPRIALAAGWFVAGDTEAGWRILDMARDQLRLPPPLPPRQHTELMLLYAETLGLAPPTLALGRLEELLQLPDRLAISSSTNCYFTLQVLRLVDSLVRAIVTEDFALSPAVRAWLDEDEFLIRRRIHRDMAAELAERGLK
ncbi:MAG: hypothetical protein NZS48_16650 [Gemmata sp.]|nr:hypothetical protein [Gemmata sp.]